MDPVQTVSSDQNGPKSNRACQACRTSKVRCRKPHDDQPCTRCSEIGRHCVPREDSNKRQKQIHIRSVDGSETRLDALTRVSQNRDVNISPTRASTGEGTTTVGPGLATTLLDTNRPENSSSVLSNEYYVAHIGQSVRDIIDEETTSMIFVHFVDNMLQHLPFMTFSPPTTAEIILETAPILLLAILDAAGDGYYDTEVSRELRKLLVKVYPTCLLDTNSYSVSLLQALIITVTWHKDLETSQVGEQMDVFKLGHAAANMATVLDTGNRLASLEARRLWLVCYYICSSASMASQTPNLMRWTRHMDECLEVLSTSDMVLCAHMRLQHLLEEFEAQLSTASSPTAIKVTCRVVKRQLAEWASALNIWSDSLKLSQQFVTLYIHELEMTTLPATSSSHEGSVTTSIIGASKFTECLSAAHASLDGFLSLDVSLIRALPTSYFVQITHTAMILMKLHFATTGLRNHEDLDLKVDDYLEQLVKKFSGWGILWPTQRLAHTFQRLLEMLRQRSNDELASESAWLDSWTLEGSPTVELVGETSTVTDHRISGIPEGLGSTGGVTISTFDQELLAWSQAGAIQSSVIQDTAPNALPSASLDATQLIDWFGTDLNTSTFDFDGNLQSMIQFFD